MAKSIKRVALIGTGVIGASWAALFLAKGLRVVATDVAPDAEAKLREFVRDAWPALEELGLAPGASQSNLTFTADMEAPVAQPTASHATPARDSRNTFAVSRNELAFCKRSASSTRQSFSVMSPF